MSHYLLGAIRANVINCRVLLVRLSPSVSIYQLGESQYLHFKISSLNHPCDSTIRLVLVQEIQIDVPDDNTVKISCSCGFPAA